MMINYNNFLFISARKTIDRPRLHSKSTLLLSIGTRHLRMLCDVTRKRFVTSDVNKLLMSFI